MMDSFEFGVNLEHNNQKQTVQSTEKAMLRQSSNQLAYKLMKLYMTAYPVTNTQKERFKTLCLSNPIKNLKNPVRYNKSVDQAIHFTSYPNLTTHKTPKIALIPLFTVFFYNAHKNTFDRALM